MAGYSRQSTITTGNTILAADFNNEYNQLITAFGSSGHAHDGTTGNGPTLSLTAAVTGTLPVANGGSGATTLTDGGVLLGSGTGAVTAMSVLANSEMIVGDGTTDPVAESGATLRTSIGVGTGDSPQVTGIELGHATDTTITRSSAGVLAVEGNVMYHASGTDIPVTDGGTGVSTLTDGGVLLGSGTGAITAMGVLSDGQIIVGDGTTDPVAESGATARTSLGAAASGANNDITSINSIAIPTAQYTSAEETKLSGIETSADVTDITNVNAAAATIVGTIGTGTWQGTAVAEAYIADNSITLAKMAHGTDGNLITYDAAGAPAAVVTGSSGQVLTSGGAGVAPTFATGAASFPSGTKMLFQQTAAPTGWTKETTHNDKALRVVTGSVSSGGATAFGTVFGSSKVSGAHTLTTGEIPSHTHTYNVASGSGSGSGYQAASLRADASYTSGAAGSGGSHTHTLSLDLHYVDFIIASKD